MLTRLSALTPINIARHVGRHVPWPVQPDAAHALPRREPAAALPDPRHAGPARADQADVPRAQHRRRALSAARSCSGSSPHAKEEGRRPNAVEAGDDFTRRQVEHYALYEAMCQREGVVDFAELLLRCYELLTHARRASASTTGGASRICWSTSSRTRTRCSTGGCAQLAGSEHRGVRRRRRRPVDLCVPRRERRQHAAFRARLRAARRAGAS